jgi:RIO kinase 1
MRILTPNDALDADWDDLSAAGRQRKRHSKKVKTDHMITDEILAHAGHADLNLGAESTFRPTFTGSRYEREWILHYLGSFYDDKQISDVLRRVKGGKEANVYCCEAHPDTGLDLIAAKVYRPRAFRQLRNDSRYRQGRELLDERGKVVRDDGLLYAVRKKSAVGKEAEHTSWVGHEYQTLLRLYQAGADVPQPVSRGSSTILMEYLGEIDTPAPTLHSVSVPRAEAGLLFDRLLHNVELMLAQGVLHGDLSAFNVLYWEGEVTLIDFPQVVEARTNAEAFPIFHRDIARLCQYFARYGLQPDANQLAADLWQRYELPLPRDWENLALESLPEEEEDED